MSANFSDLIKYFEDLARKHKAVRHTDKEKHFFRMELDEVLEGINQPSMKSPLLILEGYTFDFTDNNSDNVIKNRNGAFMILSKITDTSNRNSIQQTWDKMEQIGDEILRKIKADKRNPKVSVVRDFDFSAVEATLVAAEVDNHYGIRYTYKISSSMSVDLDENAWINEL